MEPISAPEHVGAHTVAWRIPVAAGCEVRGSMRWCLPSPQLRVDGELDQNLTESVRSFQQKNGLNPTGLMTADTLSKLGIAMK